MIPDPVPTPATFVAPPGGLPPFDSYDAIEHTRKSSRYHAQHVAELAGKFVAWAFDGSLVLAAATSKELHTALENAGIECDQYISDYIDPEPEVVVPAKRNTPIEDRAMSDIFEYTRNKSRYLSEHYRELAGQYVAWGFDGSFLRAAPTVEELFVAIADIGRENCVTGYVDPLPVVVNSATPLSRAS